LVNKECQLIAAFCVYLYSRYWRPRGATF